eukprot:1158949-Pelagomonas_calceolata.AAC.4
MDCPACWVSLPPAACANSAAAASNTSCTAAGNRCGATQAMGCPSLAHLFGPLGLQQHAQTARQPLHARYVKQQAAGTATGARGAVVVVEVALVAIGGVAEEHEGDLVVIGVAVEVHEGALAETGGAAEVNKGALVATGDAARVHEGALVVMGGALRKYMRVLWL